VFLLPHGAQEGRLRSRVFVPAHVIAGSDDHRSLGIGVTRLLIDGRAVALTALGEGWHAAEAGHRWTDGAGRIVLAGARRVEIEVGMPGLYWERATPALPSRPAVATVWG
jgi:hypothetical protein